MLSRAQEKKQKEKESDKIRVAKNKETTLRVENDLKKVNSEWATKLKEVRNGWQKKAS